MTAAVNNPDINDPNINDRDVDDLAQRQRHVDLLRRVERALAGFLAAQRRHLSAIDDALLPVAGALEAFVLGGGKRLRPAFAYWGYRGASGRDQTEVVTAVASLELLHACALIHDDVMDSSDTRRGEPAIHLRFARQHQDAGLVGDPDAFGRAAAILLGDLCLAWSDEMFHEAGLDAAAVSRAAPAYHAMRTEVMAGQYLDVLAQAVGETTAERAGKIARYKSAKYTVERPLLLGAALADAPAPLTAAYSGYGLPLGEAFQLRDDVLGVFGDPAETGKPAGDDLREGKRTFLVATAIETADETQRAVLRDRIGDPALDGTGVNALREIITATGALARTEARIEALTSAALRALGEASLDQTARAALEDLATAATRRRD